MFEYITRPFLQKTDILYFYTSYLYKHSIQTNITEKKYKWTQKYENVNNFIKYALQYIYNKLQHEIYSPSPSSKTAQRNSQHCTKLHNKVHNYGGLSRPSSFCKRFFISKVNFILTFNLKSKPNLYSISF